MLKKETRGTMVNLGKHWKTIDSFCFPPSPKTIELFEKALPFSENHWSVWKISLRPLPLLPGRGQGRGPLHSMSPSVLSSFSFIGCTAFLHFLVFFVTFESSVSWRDNRLLSPSMGVKYQNTFTENLMYLYWCKPIK